MKSENFVIVGMGNTIGEMYFSNDAVELDGLVIERKMKYPKADVYFPEVDYRPAMKTRQYPVFCPFCDNSFEINEDDKVIVCPCCNHTCFE